MASANSVFIGINGRVVALDRATGTRLWEAKLKGSDFVNVLAFQNDIYAATKGEIFCLESSTGILKWHDPLKGFGTGLVSITLPGISSGQALVRRRQQEEEAAAAAVVVST